MTPEEYAVHCERVLWLSEHPLIERDREEPDDEQASLADWGAA